MKIFVNRGRLFVFVQGRSLFATKVAKMSLGILHTEDVVIKIELRRMKFVS